MNDEENRSGEATRAAPPSRKGEEAKVEYASTGAGLTRAFWIFLGPIAIVIYLASLMRRDASFADPVSLFFWALVVLLVVVRYVDVAYFKGETSNGGPATMGDVKRFAMSAFGVCGALWLAVHLV